MKFSYKGLIILFITFSMAGEVTAVGVKVFDDESWLNFTASYDKTAIVKNHAIGGGLDLMGEGVLMLEKENTGLPFWKTTKFVEAGSWFSSWLDSHPSTIDIEWLSYGYLEKMDENWIKFSGNPLISEHAWNHATDQTLQLPSHYSDRPNDQSLERGHGVYEDKWVLFFNIGGWAVKGWGMAIADSLEPLKQGVNPFRLAEPYPLTKATGGYNAPNDWFFHSGTWYAPDESRDHTSRMWTSKDTVSWKLEGPIEGINGHDPGIIWDGEYFYLFNEDENRITVVRSDDPLAKWTAPSIPVEKRGEWENGVAVDIMDHTGDADLAYFNNRWHMFMDDGEHFHYNLAYAWTTGEEFPYGWRLTNDAFGPFKPDQNQLWDNDTEDGNSFGTGDADIALDGNTLYLTYERPIGIAYKELGVEKTERQKVYVQADYTVDGRLSSGPTISVGKRQSIKFGRLEVPDSAEKWRLNLILSTEDRDVSPMVNKMLIK
ncbi:hypothetical protein [Arenicella sp. 4NH20-0111]|uniref:hypothetical protein n=1 Tax=Arenicella sp. 4NH20-0111 TaxID=3127648 RepID=UPI00333EF24E